MKYKKYIIIIFFFLESFFLRAQTNLVPNWSFEDTISCPQIQGTSFFSYTPPWFSPTENTPDIYNSCSVTSGVPHNGGGYQPAKTGNGYAGINLLWNSNNKEYLSVKLLSPLKAEKKYCVSFYVNFFNNCYLAIDAIGAYLSNDSIFYNIYTTLPFQAQIENQEWNIIKDTVNWTLVSGEYIANGGEQFISIGNFKDDSLTHIDTIPTGSWAAYYFLDDVSVYYCGPDTTEYPNQLSISNAFTPNNDGVNEFFKVHGQNIKNINGNIINRWGEKLFEWNDLNSGWDGKCNGQDVSAGVYFYVISVTFDNGEIQEKHGSVEVVR
jgi:gliding motility-associated-like protein